MSFWKQNLRFGRSTRARACARERLFINTNARFPGVFIPRLSEQFLLTWHIFRARSGGGGGGGSGGGSGVVVVVVVVVV